MLFPRFPARKSHNREGTARPQGIALRGPGCGWAGEGSIYTGKENFRRNTSPLNILGFYKRKKKANRNKKATSLHCSYLSHFASDGPSPQPGVWDPIGGWSKLLSRTASLGPGAEARVSRFSKQKYRMPSYILISDKQ